MATRYLANDAEILAPRVKRSARGHVPVPGESYDDGTDTARLVRCACGWQTLVRRPTPRGVERAARSKHREHVVQHTGRLPLGDYLLMLCVVAVAGAVLVAIVAAAVKAGG